MAYWSKWLASLGTAVISLIGLTTLSGKFFIAESNYPGLIVVAVIAFVLSLVSASFLMYALPGVVHRLPSEKEEDDILTMGTLNGEGIKLVWFSGFQFGLFAFGITCFGIWAIVQLIRPYKYSDNVFREIISCSDRHQNTYDRNGYFNRHCKLAHRWIQCARLQSARQVAS